MSYLLWRTELCYGPVEHVEVVEEVDRCTPTTPDSSATAHSAYTASRKDTHHGPPATRSGPRRPAAAPRDEGCPIPAAQSTARVSPAQLITAADPRSRRTRVASAYLRSWYCLVPSGTSLRGLNVRVLPLPTRRCARPFSGHRSGGRATHRPKNDDIACAASAWFRLEAEQVGQTVLVGAMGRQQSSATDGGLSRPESAFARFSHVDTRGSLSYSNACAARAVWLTRAL